MDVAAHAELDENKACGALAAASVKCIVKGHVRLTNAYDKLHCQ